MPSSCIISPCNTVPGHRRGCNLKENEEEAVVADLSVKAPTRAYQDLVGWSGRASSRSGENWDSRLCLVMGIIIEGRSRAIYLSFDFTKVQKPSRSAKSFVTSTHTNPQTGIPPVRLQCHSIGDL
ncbi:uncharacterized protein LAJ45_07609 [Morchella importuna]|uniref:uncharacterized protein n=1 Tax=Morchella importuna TaxID=1174673 RepID=UPI001E8E5F32|nr:uncharacterized protein LAJ45_07609 [Morchella importuna]KAH8148506.1 hypothetical protein LAJ45_07609 [Morchella importuna]